jgi:hypothetical protein
MTAGRRIQNCSSRDSKGWPTPEGVGHPPALLAHQHQLGFALQIHVRLAADVDRHPVDRAAVEAVRRLPRVVVGEDVALLPPDVEAGARDRPCAELDLDQRLADLLVAVVQRERACRVVGLDALLLERRRQDEILAGRDLLATDDLLLALTDDVPIVITSRSAWSFCGVTAGWL